LHWNRLLAASWSISWPCWIASIAFVAVAQETKSGYAFLLNPLNRFLVSQAIMLVGPGLLLFRLVRKRYRSFRIRVLHDGAESDSRLTFSEQLQLWFQWIFPQLMFVLAMQLVSSVSLSAGATEVLNELAIGIRFLIVGPLSIRRVVMAKYSGFRLQAYHANAEIRDRVAIGSIKP
jgi:hypothetical protein